MKPQTAIEECLHRDLVRGVENHRCGPSGAGRLEAQPQARESLQVGSLEVEPGRVHQIERRNPRGDPIGPCERMGDRCPHVRVSELRKHGAVLELDHGVDDALRMDDHLHRVGTDVEEPDTPR